MLENIWTFIGTIWTHINTQRYSKTFTSISNIIVETG
jgi:hypothetical protein